MSFAIPSSLTEYARSIFEPTLRLSAGPAPCIDYLFDLGQAGIAVLGGPSTAARSVARHIATTLEPAL